MSRWDLPRVEIYPRRRAGVFSNLEITDEDWQKPCSLPAGQIWVDYPDAKIAIADKRTRFSLATGGLVSCSSIAVGAVDVSDRVALYLSHAQTFSAEKQVSEAESTIARFDSLGFVPKVIFGYGTDECEELTFDTVIVPALQQGLSEHATIVAEKYVPDPSSWTTIAWCPDQELFAVTYGTQEHRVGAMSRAMH